MREQQQHTGKNLKNLREALGYSQTEIANYLGFSDHTLVSYFENGERNIPLQYLEKLSDLFGVDLADFFEDSSKIQQVNKAFAFRKAELNQNDLKTIAGFQRIIKNYIKLLELGKSHAEV